MFGTLEDPQGVEITEEEQPVGFSNFSFNKGLEIGLEIKALDILLNDLGVDPEGIKGALLTLFAAGDSLTFGEVSALVLSIGFFAAMGGVKAELAPLSGFKMDPSNESSPLIDKIVSSILFAIGEKRSSSRKTLPGLVQVLSSERMEIFEFRLSKQTFSFALSEEKSIFSGIIFEF